MSSHVRVSNKQKGREKLESSSTSGILTRYVVGIQLPPVLRLGCFDEFDQSDDPMLHFQADSGKSTVRPWPCNCCVYLIVQIQDVLGVKSFEINGFDFTGWDNLCHKHTPMRFSISI